MKLITDEQHAQLLAIGCAARQAMRGVHVRFYEGLVVRFRWATRSTMRPARPGMHTPQPPGVAQAGHATTPPSANPHGAE